MPTILLTKGDHQAIKIESIRRDIPMQECVQEILNEWRESLRNGSKLPPKRKESRK